MNLVIHFPVKRYLKKYFYWRENLPYNSVVSLVNNDYREVCMVISHVFQGKLKIDTTGKNNSGPITHYNDIIPFELSLTHFRHNRIFVDIHSIRFFNNYLQKNLHEVLVHRIMAVRKHGVSETDVINDFLNDVDIIDDISFDALKKGSYRLRDQKNLGIFRLVNRPEP